MGKLPLIYRACRGTGVLFAALLLGLPALRLDAAPIDAAAGKQVYDHYCGSCHEIGIGARNGEGPALNGLLGMPAGTTPGYAYSPAVRHSAVVWTARSLASFIADPRGSIPGNHMNVPGVGSQTDRDAIVRYIANFTQNGSTRGN